ncbi:hypothetical protein VYU27_005130 [Nannochloropsis oceanica]
MWPMAPIRPCVSVAASSVLLLLCMGFAHAQSLTTYASRIAGLKGDETVKAMKVDNKGNTYVVGDFGSDSITIDSTFLHNFGPASKMIGGTTSDCYVAKFRPSGTLEWAFPFGGDRNEYIRDIALAPNDDGVFLVGNFESEVLLFGSEAGPPVENIIYGVRNQIELNTFIIRVSPLGKIQWVSQTGDSDVASMALDTKHGLIYLVGGYAGDPILVDKNDDVLPNFGSKWSAGLEVDDDGGDEGMGGGGLFDISSEEENDSGGINLFAKNKADIYVDHYSMATGDLIEGLVFEGDKDNFATDVTLYPQASALFITGYFYSTRLKVSPVFSLSNDEGTDSGKRFGGGRRALPAGYVVRMDSEFGSVLWGKNLGEVDASPALQIAVDDSSDSVFVTGAFWSSGVLAMSDKKTAGLLRLSQSTGGIVWAKPLPRVAAIATDLMGFVYVAGTYTRPVTWSAEVGLPIPGSNDGDVYLARAKVEDGQVVLTRSFEGERRGTYGVSAMEADEKGNVYLSGNYTKGSLNVGGQVLLSPGKDVDGFVGRVLLASEMSEAMTAGAVLAPSTVQSSWTSPPSPAVDIKDTGVTPSAAGTSPAAAASPAVAASSTAGTPTAMVDHQAGDNDGEAEPVNITSLNDGSNSPLDASPTQITPSVAPPSDSKSSSQLAPTGTRRPTLEPNNRPTRSPTIRPTPPPRFRLTWAPTAGIPGNAVGAARPDTAKAAAAPAAIAPTAAVMAAVEQQSDASTSTLPMEKMEVSFVYAGPVSDIRYLQIALYQVLKPEVSSYVSLPVVKLDTGRRRRILHGRLLAPGEECSDSSFPKILLRLHIECATEAAVVTVGKLLGDILSGKIVLKTGDRTFLTSLICSLTAVESVEVTPPPVAVKAANASSSPPPEITTTSASSSLSSSTEEKSKTAKEGKKMTNVGIGLGITFFVLVAIALVAGFVHRKAKTDEQTSAEDEIRDAEWRQAWRLEREREKMEEKSFTNTDVVTNDETPFRLSQLSPSPVSPSYTPVSLEQQEEGQP